MGANRLWYGPDFFKRTQDAVALGHTRCGGGARSRSRQSLALLVATLCFDHTPRALDDDDDHDDDSPVNKNFTILTVSSIARSYGSS